MSNESDSMLTLTYHRQMIAQNISTKLCKECSFFIIKKDKILCGKFIPEKTNCNLLKILDDT